MDSGLTPSELAGIQRLDDCLALGRVDYDEVLTLRRENGTGFDYEIEGGTKTNTVWDSITPTQDNYPHTSIPRSFEIEVNGQKMWVHGNATDHIYDDVYKGIITGKGTAYTNPNLYTQEIMSDFHGALQEVTKSGIVYGEVITQGNWEFIFAQPRQAGQLPVIKHAQFNGWH
ncbi:MAG: hypothetical protein NC089_11390 [Bacteroides sp.]|nr:hypothetical protein [Bacteroides sp.]MCM1550444.1 hypothetical protein [Clostridium sp.]